MKKITVVMAFAGIIGLAVSCKKEANESEVNNISTTYKAFVIDWTADWCNPCGQNAVPAMAAALKNYQYQIVGVSLHKKDGIVANYDITDKLKEAFDLAGTPQFVVGAESLQAGSVSIDGKIKTQLGANGQAYCGIGVSKKIDGNTVKVNYNLKFFKDYADGAKVLFIAIENHIPGTQTGNPSLKEHNEVARAGDFSSIVTGAISKGASFEGSIDLPLPADVVNKDNIEVVAVVFNNGITAHLNANSTATH